MNTDERLDRLTERHEALTLSVELLTQSQHKNEVLMAQILESINSPARISRVHEQRISDLESRQT